MVVIDCPWCTEPAMVEVAETDDLACEGCGVRATLAPDHVALETARAA